MRSGAKLRHDVSPERKGSKKTSFERKVLNSYISFSLTICHYPQLLALNFNYIAFAISHKSRAVSSTSSSDITSLTLCIYFSGMLKIAVATPSRDI